MLAFCISSYVYDYSLFRKFSLFTWLYKNAHNYTVLLFIFARLPVSLGFSKPTDKNAYNRKDCSFMCKTDMQIYSFLTAGFFAQFG